MIPASVHDPAPRPSGREGSDVPLCLFDAIGAFAALAPPGVVNWSKIPFAALEREGRVDPAAAGRVRADFARLVAAMAGLGATGVVLDDLAHLVVHPFYPEPLRWKLASYAPLYRDLAGEARRRGLAVFVTTDVMFFNPAIEAYLAETAQTPDELLEQTMAAAFAAYPELAGVVLRIGEEDGVDVRADFASRLTIARPSQARRLLGRLLPRCEALGKTLIVRTWTLGAGPIGDLIWNKRTYDAVFAGIDSPALLVSLKYGESDFFRFLPLNPLFFHGPQRKLIELQCRREYEGMGEFPAFTGWLYDRYLRELRAGGANLAGIYAIQGGGWAPFRRFAFAGDGIGETGSLRPDGASLWNELNAEVTVALATREVSVEAAVAEFCGRRGLGDPGRFLELLRLSERAIEEGLYVRELAERPLYFRRVRLPPLLWVFWHHVTVGGLVGLLHRHLVRDRAAAIAEGRRAVAAVAEMAALGREIGLPAEAFAFQLATFRLLAALRESLLGEESAEGRERLAGLLAAYRAAYPDGYAVDAAGGWAAPSRSVGLLLRLLLRGRMDYRLGDRVLLTRLVSGGKRALARRLLPRLPRFVDRQGMSAEVLLR